MIQQEIICEGDSEGLVKINNEKKVEKSEKRD